MFYDKDEIRKVLISIHAPLRGRRYAPHTPLLPFGISIHAPLRGRHNYEVDIAFENAFQSTPPCGGDD